MEENRRYLLLIGCSQRKYPKSGLVRALDLYEGVNYRVVRKAKQDGYWPDTLQVRILSAKYGLLDPESLIERYDQRMTQERAQSLQQDVGAELDAILTQRRFDEVFINLGRFYLLAVATSQELPKLGGRAHYAIGGIGERMAQMKGWLIQIAKEGGEPQDRG